MPDSSFLLTGGTGFIGRHVHRLLRDRFPGSPIRVLSRSPDSVAADDPDHIALDLAGSDDLSPALDGVGVVLHLAGFTRVGEIAEDPVRGLDVNIHGTARLLEAARRAGVDRVVFVSSVRVLGAATGGAASPLTEDLPLAPAEPYGAQKGAAELYCRAYRRRYGLDTVILRPSVVYGPGRRMVPGSMSGVVARFATLILRDEPLTIVGDGSQRSDFVHVTDVARAIVTAATADVAGEVFHLGSGRPVSIVELARLIGRVAGRKPQFEYLPATADTIDVYPSIERAADRLHWRPEVSLADGLRDYLAWLEASEGNGHPQADVTRSGRATT